MTKHDGGRPKTGLTAAAVMLLIALLVTGGVLIGYVPTADSPVTEQAVAADGLREGIVPGSPTHVSIPAIGVKSDLLELGLNTDGTLEVPEDPMRAGWYVHSPIPGEEGPSIIVGHRDSAKSRKGIFQRLDTLQPGDQITVRRSDGQLTTFRVDEMQTVGKKTFPTKRVYGNTKGPTLRLITCGGALVNGHWRDNVIVFASHVRTERG